MNTPTNKINWLDLTRTVASVATGIALVVLVLYLFGVGVAPEAPIERGFVTACYNGSSSNVTAGSGCTWNVQSGATLTVDSGATETHANDVTFSGTTTFSGATTQSGAQTINNNLTVTGTTNLQGATSISNTLITTGAFTLNNSATITGTILATGDISGTATLAGNPTGVANTYRIGATGIVIEGATADAIESLLTFADPTSADKTYTFPDSTGTVILQTADTIGANPALAASGIVVGTTGVIYEGSTADAIEGLLTVTDPTSSDKTYTLPDASGTVVLTGQTGNVDATMIANITRSVPLPTADWVNCTTPADLNYSSGADDDADFEVVNSALTIEYDATGGSVDADEICTTFTVPADYVSGGSFTVRMTQDAATVTQIETFSCRISVDGAAIGAANAGNAVNQTAVQTVTSTPAGTWAAGASIGVVCKQGNATADDTVNFLSIEGRYTATQ